MPCAVLRLFELREKGRIKTWGVPRDAPKAPPIAAPFMTLFRHLLSVNPMQGKGQRQWVI